MESKKGEKIYFLTGIKGMSAIVVILYHMLSAVYPPIINKTALIRPESLFLTKIAISPLNIFFDGNLAVAFFFLISGFFTAKACFNSKLHNSAEKFFKRYIRLAPYIFISVMLIYISIRIEINKSHEFAQATQSAWLAQFYTVPVKLSTALAEALYGSLIFGVCSMNPTLWTMQYIFWGSFYVIGTTVLVMNRDWKHRILIYTALSFMLFNTYYLGYILSVALYDYYNNRSNIRLSRYLYVAALFVGLFFASYPAEFPTDNTIYGIMSKLPWTYQVPMFWHNIGAALIIFAFFGIEKLQKLMSFKILLFLGDISYEIYILGFWLQNTVFANIFLHNYKKGYYGRGFLIAAIITYIILIICSVILKKVYYNLEKVCVSFYKNIIIYYRNRKNEYRR